MSLIMTRVALDAPFAVDNVQVRRFLQTKSECWYTVHRELTRDLNRNLGVFRAVRSNVLMKATDSFEFISPSQINCHEQFWDACKCSLVVSKDKQTNPTCSSRSKPGKRVRQSANINERARSKTQTPENKARSNNQDNNTKNHGLVSSG